MPGTAPQEKLTGWEVDRKAAAAALAAAAAAAATCLLARPVWPAVGGAAVRPCPGTCAAAGLWLLNLLNAACAVASAAEQPLACSCPATAPHLRQCVPTVAWPLGGCAAVAEELSLQAMEP